MSQILLKQALKRSALLLIGLLTLSFASFAQITVTGTVSDETGETLIGATVALKGTTIAVNTDIDGNFVLPNVPNDGVLVISYVGYQPQEVEVKGRTQINVMMVDDVTSLAEGSVMELYSYGFDMIYDWSYCTDLQDFYKGKIDFAKLLANTQAKEAQIPEGKTIMRYVVNHDVISEHSPVELYGSNDAILGAYVITAFMSEVPLIYSGMEAGFDGRTAFIGAKPLTWNASILEEYDQIMSAYKATATARGGKLVNYSNGGAAIFAHANGASEVLVMVNPTKAELTVKVPMAYQGKNMRNALTGQDAALTAGVTLPAYGYCIFSK